MFVYEQMNEHGTIETTIKAKNVGPYIHVFYVST